MENCLHTFVVLAYKESNFLENCITSVVNQTYKSNVIIATSTPNEFINDLAKKYNLEIVKNPRPGLGIGYDFDFAVSVGKTLLVTVAHQDDIYDKEYSKKVVEKFIVNQKSTIIFSDYYEIRDGIKVPQNRNLKIKKLLLSPLKLGFVAKRKFGKRMAISFGCSICCPAVTFVKKNIISSDIFKCDLMCNVDWYAWEKLSLLSGSFVLINEALMGHRIHEESTTTEIIKDNIRTTEDLFMFKKFWPSWIANKINKFYIKSEESNK